jgi:phosphoglycerol transferase
MIVEGRWLRFWQPNSSSVADPGVRRLRITRRIDFSQMRLSPAIAGVKGLSGRESWGRWSDADVHPHVEIRFRDPLPVSGTLALTARAFGPNVGQPIRVRIGRYETQLHFDAQDTTAMASYALHEAPRLLEIVPPHPMQPRELGASSDPRRLGIGLVRLTIRAA